MDRPIPRWRAFRRRKGKTHKGSMRPATFRFVNAGRCLGCQKPIVLTIIQGEVPRWVPVDISSWDPPSSFYIKGKHRNHLKHCPDFFRSMREWQAFRASDVYVESEDDPFQNVTSRQEIPRKPQ